MNVSAVSSSFRRISRVLAIGGLGAVSLLLSWSLPAHAEQASEGGTATILYNLALFVTWPEPAVSAASPLVVCLLGESPIGDELPTLGEAGIGERPVEIRQLDNAAQARQCQMVFIGRSEETELPQILSELGDAPVLTVSGMADFARRGGMVGLVGQGEGLRFELNSAVAREAGLAFDAGLKRVALTVLGAGE